MRRVLYRILMLLIAAGVVAAIVYAFLPKPVEVDIAPVTRGLMQVAVEDDGRTRIRNRYTVSAPVGGRLQRIELKRGMPIKANETVIAVIKPNLPDLKDHLDRTVILKQIEQAKENLKSAKKEFEYAQRDLERVKKSATSQDELDKAALRERVTEYAINLRQYELEIAEARLSVGPHSIGDENAPAFKVVAQRNGVVLDVPQESERVVPAGVELLLYGDPADLEAVVDVLTTDAANIKEKMKVYLDWGRGLPPLEARVELVEKKARMKLSALGVEEQRVDVVINFADYESREKWQSLGDEYRVDARIITWEKENVIRVPAGALFRRGGDWAVFVVENGRAALRTLRIGKINGQEAEVLGGLSENDEVILHPSDKVKDGAAVTPRNHH